MLSVNDVVKQLVPLKTVNDVMVFATYDLEKSKKGTDTLGPMETGVESVEEEQ